MTPPPFERLPLYMEIDRQADLISDPCTGNRNVKNELWLILLFKQHGVHYQRSIVNCLGFRCSSGDWLAVEEYVKEVKSWLPFASE